MHSACAVPATNTPSYRKTCWSSSEVDLKWKALVAETLQTFHRAEYGGYEHGNHTSRDDEREHCSIQ
jgi:hypothetical protein